METEASWITAMTWPQLPGAEGLEQLLLGTITGIVVLLKLHSHTAVREELVHCSQPFGEKPYQFMGLYRVAF